MIDKKLSLFKSSYSKSETHSINTTEYSTSCWLMS